MLVNRVSEMWWIWKGERNSGAYRLLKVEAVLDSGITNRRRKWKGTEREKKKTLGKHIK
jgi:hypothetical protein